MKNKLLIELGIIKICGHCDFKTESRKEMREHGIRIHKDKHSQYNDKKYQMERKKNAK